MDFMWAIKFLKVFFICPSLPEAEPFTVTKCK